MSYRPPRDREELERLEARRKAEWRERLAAHRGMATWGERLVPLGEFRDRAQRSGRALSPEQAAEERERYLAPRPRETPVEGPFSRIAVFGGVYNNHLALAEVLTAAQQAGAEAIYCLGDLGGFGPSPDKVWPLLLQGDVRTIQGNYEQSLAADAGDCNCGYADPRDNQFAALSYLYTARETSPEFKRWMGDLPEQRRVRVGRRELLLVHGSPRRVNEFLFESTAPDAFLEVLLRQEACDGILCTHTGLHWHRHLPSGGDVVNVGVIGRPANDGGTDVWFALIEERGDGVGVELRPLAYDHQGLAEEMRREELPEEFVETVLTGWWTTCLEILPPKERGRSRF